MELKQYFPILITLRNLVNLGLFNSTSSEESVWFGHRPAVLASLSRPLISTELLLLLAALTSSLSAGPWRVGVDGPAG